MITLGNATGWNELMNGSVAKATFKVLDSSLGGTATNPGYLMLLLFFVLQSMIYIRTKNLGLSLSVGLFLYGGFAAMGILYDYFSPQGISVAIIVLVLELGGILYYSFFKT